MKFILLSMQNDIDVVGLKFVHYTLLDKGHKSYLVFLKKEWRHPLKELVREIKPDYIGISLMSQDYFKAKEVTEYLKPFSIPIIWGGTHPTISPEKSLETADYVCMGESENSVIDIANGKNIQEVNNICYRQNGNIKKNPLYSLISDLDSIPTYDHIPKNAFVLANKIIPLDKKMFKKYSRYFGTIYHILTTRGCLYKCTYCISHFLSNMYGSYSIRRRSVGNVIAELEKAIADNVDIETVVFHDDSFLFASDEYLTKFSCLYKKRINKPFQILTAPVHVTDNKIRLLKEAGVMWVSMGLQSGSDEVCRELYKRNSTKKKFFEAADILKKYRIPMNYDIIIDNPFETQAQQYETIDAITQVPRPAFPRYFSLTLYHGTELYEKAKREKPLEIDDPTTKCYYVSHKTTMNLVYFMSAFLPRKYILKLISFPQESMEFKILFNIGKVLTLFYYPVNYIRLMMMFQNGTFSMIITPLKWFVWGLLNRANMSKYRRQIKKE